MKMTVIKKVLMTIKTELWWTVTFVVMVAMVVNVTSLSGPNVCMVKQKYNITKRVKYRAPMSVRTYEWCFAMPPRCSKWNTEMRDLTRLETEERTAEMAVCCPGFKLKDISCVPTCPSGKTGQGCTEDCPWNKWGPSCAHDCLRCHHGRCDAVTGECRCQDGWQGERCEISMTTTAAAAMMEQLLTTESASTKTTTQTMSSLTTSSSTNITIATTSRSASTPSGDSAPTTSRSTVTTGQPVTTAIISTSTEDIQATIASSSITSTPIHTTQKELEFTKAFSTPNTHLVFINVSTSTVPMSTLNTYTIVAEEYKPTNSKSEEFVKKVTNKESETLVHSSYNRTEIPSGTSKIVPSISKTMKTTDITTVENNVVSTFNPTTSTSSSKITTKGSTALTTTTNKSETRKTTTMVRQPTTKLKPKEIWIKPAQKGESPIVEVKVKPNQEIPHLKFRHKEEVTTPKTIIVSIIPTSVTYVTFKKFALTTASSVGQQSSNSTKILNNRTTEKQFTKPMIIPTTSTPFAVRNQPRKLSTSSVIKPMLHQNVTKMNLNTSTTRRTFRTTLPTKLTTNSMSSTVNVANKILNSSLSTTAPSFSTNVTKSTRKEHSLSEMTAAPPKHKITLVTEKITQSVLDYNQSVGTTHRNVINRFSELPQVTKIFSKMQRNFTNTNKSTSTVTDEPSKDEETFHILTEPEHITAVMGDKGHERSTVDLISVISIAGGVMLAVITVATVIVMLERCKKPRYEDVRKYNDIRMQVMIDNNDVPPPYVRSIFHTPLPDPPTSEKCHYQPISTLDRNLKQFMRPVVVQTISPLMLENFRGILECHYDHLPRRSQDMGTLPARCSVAPSVDEREELLPPPRVHSLTDSDIEAMKCEAKLDVIDNTTSEPLYAEIPCWRPPSEHAVEVVNTNGEAVTEL